MNTHTHSVSKPIPKDPLALHVLSGEKGFGTNVDYETFMDCVHCGLCLGSCPTYVETGDENDSPRGRIYLWRAVTDGRTELTPEVRKHMDVWNAWRAKPPAHRVSSMAKSSPLINMI